MLVSVNAVAARSGGALRHLSPFLSGVAKALPESEFRTFIPGGFDGSSLPENVRSIPISVPGGMSLKRLIWDQIRFPKLSQNADVWLSPLNLGSARRAVPHILHQRNSIYFDEPFLRSTTPKLRAILVAYRQVAMLSMRSADTIVVPSTAMAELLSKYPTIARKIVVLHHGFDWQEASLFSQRTLPPQAEAWAKHDVALLFVGNIGPHKNLECLPRILGRLRARGVDAHLAVTFTAKEPSLWASAFFSAAESSHLGEHITFLGPVDSRDVFSLYREASVLLFPSLSESFGFPLLEALAVRTPIVATDIPSNREITGGHARFFAPSDLDEAVELVAAAASGGRISESDELRNHQRRFDWHDHCQRMATLLCTTADARR